LTSDLGAHYFNGHLPVFVHEKNVLATFGFLVLIGHQLQCNSGADISCIRGAAGNRKTLHEAVKLYRAAGVAAFFAPAKKRSAAN
jgi:hypothetical protein